MRHSFVILASIIMMTALSGCWRTTADWHQKLTLVVDTPAGEASGSSVIEVRFAGRNKVFLSDLDSATFRMHGEAVVVEVLPGKYLFALLGGQDQLLYVLLGENGKGMEQTIPAILAQREPLTVDPRAPSRFVNHTYSPMLVTFDDISDPKSVKLVDPLDLAASFGPGVSLKSVTIQITDEPVTQGRIERVLGWLSSAWPNRLDGQRFGTIRTDHPFANSLSANSFSTEIHK